MLLWGPLRSLCRLLHALKDDYDKPALQQLDAIAHNALLLTPLAMAMPLLLTMYAPVLAVMAACDAFPRLRAPLTWLGDAGRYLAAVLEDSR